MTPWRPLWHYTCDHGRAGIGEAGYLWPHVHPVLHWRLAWATDLEVPDADALGLTSTLLPCDRTRFRYSVDPARFVPWRDWWPGKIDPRTVSELEYPPLRPDRWWVSELPARATLAPLPVQC